jgi:hypothetical protein
MRVIPLLAIDHTILISTVVQTIKLVLLQLFQRDLLFLEINLLYPMLVSYLLSSRVE